MSLTFHDMFCGAGGSTLGALQAGATPSIGLNHWQVACDSYDENHNAAGGRAACVDVVTQDPRRYPAADLLLASPECTHHSYARGKQKDDPSLFDPDADQDAQRSRATMWDVVRFAEAHAYRAVIVENVGAAVKWGLRRGQKLKHGEYGPLFVAWLQAMEALDYRWQVVHLNSMVCGVPQSRDRLYVVFWRRGQRAPDLDIRALGWCWRCDGLVNGQQAWKRPGSTLGTYGPSYVYACPSCATPIALAVRPAAAAIDWSLPAVKIGERARPLKDATMERIRRGLERLRERPATIRLRDGLVVQVGGNLFTRPGASPRAWPVQDPMPCVTGTSDRALVLPTTHPDESQRSRRADSEVTPTITGANRGELAMVLALRKDMDGRDAAAAPVATLSTHDTTAVVVTCRGDAAGADRRATDTTADPLSTLSAGGTHHGLVVSNMTNNVPRRAGDEAMATVTSGGKLGLVMPAGGNPAEARSTDDPAHTIVGSDRLAVVATLRGHNTPTLPDGEVIDTVSAQGTHHALVIANYGMADSSGGQGWARHVDDGPVGTVTATDSHALFNYRAGQGIRHPDEPLDTLTAIENRALLGEVTEEEIAECTFRMLQPAELKIASGFTPEYVLLGNKRDQVCQVGNAVTAPVEAELVRRVIASLDA